LTLLCAFLPWRFICCRCRRPAAACRCARDFLASFSSRRLRSLTSSCHAASASAWSAALLPAATGADHSAPRSNVCCLSHLLGQLHASFTLLRAQLYATKAAAAARPGERRA
jgi:hypothetical protein